MTNKKNKTIHTIQSNNIMWCCQNTCDIRFISVTTKKKNEIENEYKAKKWIRTKKKQEQIIIKNT